MHPTKRHSERLKKYESFQSKYDFGSLTYPVSLKDIGVFCRRNDCSIDVYGISNGRDDQDDIEDDEIEDDQEVDEIGEGDIKSSINNQRKEGVVYPLKVVKDIIKKRHVNLLLTEKNGQHHNKTIKNFSRLVRSQISRKKCQHFFCYSSMHGFTNKKLLQKHRERSCKIVNAQRSEMPTDPTFRFTNVYKPRKAPFVVYADFGCILKDVPRPRR